MAFNSQTLNVLQLGIGFFFVFFAFNSQGFIEESVLDSFAARGIVERHDGYESLAIIYASFTLTNVIAAPIVNALGSRWALFFGASTYTLFQAGFLFVNRWYLFASSALLGLGAAVIWTAQGKYLSLNSNEQTAGKHSGLFWALTQACQVCGGLFLLAVFLFHKDSEHHSGFSLSTVLILYGAFTAVTVLGAVVLALLRLPPSTERRRQGGSPTPSELVNPVSPGSATRQPLQSQNDDEPVEHDGEDAVNETSHLGTIKSTFELARTYQFALLTFPCLYAGLVVCFWSSVFPTSIANIELFQLNQGIDPKVLLALNSILQGLGQSSAGLLFCILDTRTSRVLGSSLIVLVGTSLQLIAYSAIFASFPPDASLEKTLEEGRFIAPKIWLTLLSGFFIGFGDSCWNTQIFSLLIKRYPGSKSAPAFSLFNFYKSLATFCAFFYASLFSLQWHLLILTIGVLVGLATFVCVERRNPSEAYIGAGIREQRRPSAAQHVD